MFELIKDNNFGALVPEMQAKEHCRVTMTECCRIGWVLYSRVQKVCRNKKNSLTHYKPETCFEKKNAFKA